MATQVEVVYPQNAAWSSPAQLNIGPYPAFGVKRLLRVEFHGRMNTQGALVGSTSVGANTQLWAVQWVPHGGAPLDCQSSPDGSQWPIRQQAGDMDIRTFWGNATTDAYEIGSVGMDASWAGQLSIFTDIDLYWCTKSPSGIVPGNFNVFGSLRWWWS